MEGNNKMKYIQSFEGWLDKTDECINYSSIALLASTLATYYKKNSSSGQKLIIGYDTREYAKEVAEFFACVMAKKGVKVFLSNRPTPSSVCVISALHKKSLGTVVITGDEFRSSFLGIRAFDMQSHFLNEEILRDYHDDDIDILDITEQSIRSFMKKGIVELFDSSIIYDLFVRKVIDFQTMLPVRNQLLFNPFYGSGMFYFDYILKEENKSVGITNGVTIHSAKVFDFEEIEPKPTNLVNEMKWHMKEDKTSLGLVLSPDCTTFEFLVDNNVLPKNVILSFLVEQLQKTNEEINVLLETKKGYIDFTHNKRVQLEYAKETNFQTLLREKKYDIAMDKYERIYFSHHGAPDALLCGFYLFSYFNQKGIHSEEASHLLTTSTNY